MINELSARCCGGGSSVRVTLYSSVSILVAKVSTTATRMLPRFLLISCQALLAARDRLADDALAVYLLLATVRSTDGQQHICGHSAKSVILLCCRLHCLLNLGETIKEKTVELVVLLQKSTLARSIPRSIYRKGNEENKSVSSLLYRLYSLFQLCAYQSIYRSFLGR